MFYVIFKVNGIDTSEDEVSGMSHALLKKCQYLESQQTFVLMKTSLRRLSSSSSEDVFKTSSRRLGQDQYIRLGYTSSRRLQDVFKTSSRRLAKTSSRHLQDVFKTFWRRLQDVLQRYLQDVFKTYHQVKLFLLTSLQDVFNMFLRRTTKRTICRRICLGHTSEKVMVSVQNLEES